MLKKVDASQLRVGMFIHDLDCGWMEHPFVRSQFLLSCESEIQKIRDARIHGVVIDCSRGMDVDAPTLAECYLVPQIESARRFKVDLSRWPLIMAIDAACAELEAFKQAAPAAQPDAA